MDCLWFQCKEKIERCTCNGVDVQNSGGDDHRTVGLAGATGALGGALAAGSALAAYFHFRGAAAAEEEGEGEEGEMERNWSVAGEEHLRGPDQREVMLSPTAVKAP